MTRIRFEPELSASDLAILDARQRKVLALRAELSFQSISKELGVSKERVRQIQNRAIEKLTKRIPGLRVVTTNLERKRMEVPKSKDHITPITPEILGHRIHIVLKASGLTQQRLAAAVGTSQPTINDYIHGRVMPTIPILERIATALGVRLRQLVDPD
jgi:ribosome-binding protein aMBF1 (putative translation factor)